MCCNPLEMAPTVSSTLLHAACLFSAAVQADIEVGLGIGDITGPVADVQMMVRVVLALCET